MGSKRERERVLSDGDKERRKAEFGREEWEAEEGEMKHSGRLGKSLTDAHSLYVCAPLSPFVYSLSFLPAFIKSRICHLLPEHHFRLLHRSSFWALAPLWGQLQHCGAFRGHKYRQRVPNLQRSCEERGGAERRLVQGENMGQRSGWMQLFKCTAPESDHSERVCCTVNSCGCHSNS